MATQRDRPYSQFNFQVSWDTLDPLSVQAGFQEVTGLGMEVTVSEYRAGNSMENHPIKITNLVKTPDVTFKRGVIGATDLFEWIDAVRNGAQDDQGTPPARRNVRVMLMSEDRQDVVLTWILSKARPMKYTGPSLNGKGTDLAMEELVLACERIDLE